MSLFKNYYESVIKTFKFRIKSVGRLGDEEMDVIERVLDKYRPSKMTQPKKMMFQTEPLGFTGVENVEVYFLDVVLTVPARAPTLAYDLRTAFGLNPASPLIQVEGEHDDPTADQKEASEAQEKAKKDGALLTQPDYPEAVKVNPEEHFGDAYNKSFLAYVKKVEEERDLNAKIDAPHPITKWEKQPKDQNTDIDKTHFNAHLATDKVKPFAGRKSGPKNPKEQG